MIPKFRAWDKEGEVMCEVDVIGFSEGAVTISNENVKYYHLGINEIELMQYTGLKDKNGVEIYEGDIVTYIDKHGQRKIGKVNYANAKYYIGNFEALGYAGERYELEVIGNIYEDEELKYERTKEQDLNSEMDKLDEEFNNLNWEYDNF